MRFYKAFFFFFSRRSLTRWRNALVGISFDAVFKSAAHLSRLFFGDNIELEKLMYRRPASGRTLRTSLAASVLGISKWDSFLAYISCVDHKRLADEFTQLDALDKFSCPASRFCHKLQSPHLPYRRTRRCHRLRQQRFLSRKQCQAMNTKCLSHLPSRAYFIMNTKCHNYPRKSSGPT